MSKGITFNEKEKLQWERKRQSCNEVQTSGHLLLFSFEPFVLTIFKFSDHMGLWIMDMVQILRKYKYFLPRFGIWSTHYSFSASAFVLHFLLHYYLLLIIVLSLLC